MSLRRTIRATASCGNYCKMRLSIIGRSYRTRRHSGNKAEHTEGCILVGFTKGKDFIGNSKSAFIQFMPKLQAGLKTGKVFIEITREPIIGA